MIAELAARGKALPGAAEAAELIVKTLTEETS